MIRVKSQKDRNPYVYAFNQAWIETQHKSDDTLSDDTLSCACASNRLMRNDGRNSLIPANTVHAKLKLKKVHLRIENRKKK